jgi:chemotaxis protein MotB
MAEAKTEEIILVRRRRAGHAVHHGGAWKVAYADFVTAMMSLFIVLWLTSSNEAVKKSVAQYFNDPKGTSTQHGTNKNGSGNSVPLAPRDVQNLKARLLAAAREMPNFDTLKGQIEITAQQDGLRIELLEQPGGTFFELGSPEPTAALRQFLQVIAPELGKMQTRISIEGHTDSVPYAGGGAYTNWELSADRANAARRLISSSGVQPSQIAEVRGFADQLPRHPDAPADPSNRRITLIVNTKEDSARASEAGGASAKISSDPTSEIAAGVRTEE